MVRFSVLGCAFWGFPLSFALLHLFPPLHLLVAGPDAVVRACVTKRRSSWACIGNPKPEQETIKGTHAQETSAYQRRPTSQHAAQGSNPPIRALYMKIAHTHQTTPRATSAASADQHDTHRGRNRYHPSAHKLKTRRRGNSPAPKNTSRH